MRSRLKFTFGTVALAACALALAFPVSAQNPDTIPAEQSTAAAKAVLQQLIEALGGPAYLNVHDSDCTGRLSQFGPLTGQLGGYIEFQEFRIPPDKLRREYFKKGKIIDVYNGDHGWSLDRGGVEDGDAVAIANFQSGVMMSLDNLLRLRLADPGFYFHWGGEDVVDLKQADWVQIEDTDARTFRIAVDRSTHLPIRFVVATRNPQTREVVQETTTFGNWHPQDGVQTPFTTARERDGKRTSQVFFYGCKYNTGVSPNLFTRESLAKRWTDTGHKSK